MAESISEGTLKQWSKKVGDYVEQDEELATIETDKVAHAEPVSPMGLANRHARLTLLLTRQKPASSRSF